jgi:antitoxin component YwqK of YwqJK toxin-antitoxin module
MEQERYEVAEGIFYLMDPELKLHIQEPFPVPYLPMTLSSQAREEDQDLFVETDPKGNLERAYFKKEGRFHGQLLFFYPNGKIKGESFYL